MQANKKRDKYNDPFPQRLRELMEKRGTTQQTLAEAVGVKRQTISAYADGSADPTFPKLCAMADYFGLSLDYLAGKAECAAPSNEQIHKMLGLSEAAIEALKDMNQPHDEVLVTLNKPRMKTINTLLSTDQGQAALRRISLYLNCDFSHAYIETVTGQIVDLTTISVPRNGGEGVPLAVPVGALSEAMLATAADALRIVRRQEAKKHDCPDNRRGGCNDAQQKK